MDQTEAELLYATEKEAARRKYRDGVNEYAEKYQAEIEILKSDYHRAMDEALLKYKTVVTLKEV